MSFFGARVIPGDLWLMARLARSSCPIILAIICFAPVLCREHQFGFRDAADFYYPLQLRVQQEWRAGRLPLWEPKENGGVPRGESVGRGTLSG